LEKRQRHCFKNNHIFSVLRGGRITDRKENEAEKDHGQTDRLAIRALGVTEDRAGYASAQIHMRHSILHRANDQSASTGPAKAGVQE
tara:strand:- start:782 stop:1042 length:261 start_codon:yes stop_codon:yes gene_type:complete